MALPANVQASMISGFRDTIAALGVTFAWSAPDDTVVAASVVAAIRMVGLDDAAIVNAYGIETRVISLDAATCPRAPLQFDAFLLAGSARYVVQAVREVRVNDTLVGFKCYCRSQ